MVAEKTLKRDPTAMPGDDEPARPHLFVILECQRPRSGGARYALDGVDEVVVGRGATRSATREKEGGTTRLMLRFPDPLMSGTHARLARTNDGWEVVDLGSTNGTYVSGAKVPRADVDDAELFELGSTLFVVRHELPTPADATPNVESHSLGGRAHGFATLLPSYSRLMRALLQMAITEMPILLLGESGSGKEVLAAGIHAVSGRKGDLVAVNCGGIPENLVEGQLFGHIKGAFSGALRDEPGFVRASDKGTLFLDEIGDLPRTSQAALLRVLQEREVTPVGSTKATKVDLRVVSATHRRVDLGASDAFRSDLYARVAGYTHHLAPLRDRKEDLGMLIADLLERLAPSRDVRVTPAFGRALYHFDWPLNVRELLHALKAAAVFAEEGPLDVKHLPEPIRNSRPARVAESSSTEGVSTRPLTEEENLLKTKVEETLAATHGNVSEVARSMGKTRMQVHRWMRRFGLDPEAYRK